MFQRGAVSLLLLLPIFLLIYTSPTENLDENLRHSVESSMRTTETMDSVGKTRPANSAKVAILLSDHQSASTEMAELISKHPCGVSFDELLMDSTERPRGNAQYRVIDDDTVADYGHDRIYLDHYTGLKSIYPHRENIITSPLENILLLRDNYCDMRHPALKNICGDTCVVALTMHRTRLYQRTWFLYSEQTHVILTEREAYAKFCSLQRLEHDKAKEGRKGGEAGEAGEAGETDDLEPFACDYQSEAAVHYRQKNDKEFAFFRNALFEKQRKGTATELSFREWMSSAATVRQKIYEFLQLPAVSEGWFSDEQCSVPWCRKQRYPCCALQCEEDGSTSCPAPYNLH